MLNLTPFHAASPRRADRAASRRLDGERNRLFLDAVFEGRYPADVRRVHAADTDDFACVKDGDMATIATPIDFLGINYYMSQTVAADAHNRPEVQPADGPTTAIGWTIDPAGLHDILLRVRDRYSGDLPLLVSENGASFRDDVDPEGRCKDDERIDYLRRHLQQAARALAAGVPLKGYVVWSLLDNFEWDSGYRERFGLVHVDYPTQRRTPKDSFDWYRHVIASGVIG